MLMVSQYLLWVYVLSCYNRAASQFIQTLGKDDIQIILALTKRPENPNTSSSSEHSGPSIPDSLGNCWETEWHRTVFSEVRSTHHWWYIRWFQRLLIMALGNIKSQPEKSVLISCAGRWQKLPRSELHCSNHIYLYDHILCTIGDSLF